MFSCARQRGVDMPEDFAAISDTIARVESILDLRRNEFVPCHNDLYGANILQTPQGDVRLVDYDLSGNGDRCYELGFFSTYSDLNAEQVAHLCEDYFGSNDAKIRARVELMGLAADYNSVGL
ncbi:phosphotransferase family protein [Vreelandella neptunia]|uniref:phosphotransferase family protein n=1 Tax=Vreelandella neptunia TaxID=115551 RepID=UPI00315A4FA6